ncbi:MAG: ADP-ribosylation factor-like protein [Promethearchaeota archaeon]
MNGWISESEVTSLMGYKILLAGLSEAGKTSVKRIFFFKQTTTDVDNLSATIDYERMAVSISDTPITIVDLGGQRVFIKQFLTEFSPFIFSSVHTFIFVIDVAAKSTRNDAIKYFSSCVERLQKYSPETEYFVFLHKNDLVRLSPNYESIHEQLKERFQLECPIKIRFLRTTIYDPKSVVDAFGRIFEITLPNIAKSEYVNGQIIGEIEEYAQKFAAVELQDACCPKCSLQFIETREGLICNFCGYKRSLGQISQDEGVFESTDAVTIISDSDSLFIDALQSDLKAIPVEKDTTESISPVSSPSPALKDVTPIDKDDRDSTLMDELQSELQEILIEEDAADFISPVSLPTTLPQDVSSIENDNHDSAFVDELQSELQDILVEEDTAEPVPADTISSIDKPLPHPTTHPTTYLSETTVEEVSKEIGLTPITATSSVSEADEIEKPASSVFHISFLTSFYGIKKEEAEKLVESGYTKIFETAAKAGVPIRMLLNIFFKNIPYLKDKGLSVKDIEAKIIDILFAYLKGKVKEDEVFHCLIFTAKYPELSMDAIIKNNLAKLREEEKQKELEKALPTVQSAEEMLIPEVDIGELEEGVTPLSSQKKLGFKAEREDYNFLLTFYHGTKQLGSNLVPKTITIRDIKYLLIFETELPIKENLKEFAETAAPIIFNTINKLVK